MDRALSFIQQRNSTKVIFKFVSGGVHIEESR